MKLCYFCHQPVKKRRIYILVETGPPVFTGEWGYFHSGPDEARACKKERANARKP